MGEPMFLKIRNYRLNIRFITDYYFKDKYLNINLSSGQEINLEDPSGRLFHKLDELMAKFMVEV